MRIWWCQEHEASADGPEVWNCLREGAGPCRMVPMRLIPDNALEPEQVEMLIQALGDVLVASGISNVPLSGPELLAHAESLRQRLEAERGHKWWCEQHSCVSTDGAFTGCVVTQEGTWDFKACRIVPYPHALVGRIAAAIKAAIWKVPTGSVHDEAAQAAAMAVLAALDRETP